MKHSLIPSARDTKRDEKTSPANNIDSHPDNSRGGNYFQIKNLIAPFFFVLSIIIFNTAAKATHISGADFTYRCVGNNKYIFTFNMFLDCNIPQPLWPFYELEIISDCGDTLYVTDHMGKEIEVSQLCPSALPFSTCKGSSYPGRSILAYTSDTVTLPTKCNVFSIRYLQFDRNGTTNVSGSSGATIFIEDMINTSVRTCNNSPTFNTPYPIPYVCVGQQVNYNFAIQEIDGDSLSFALICGQSRYNKPLTYASGYSCALPIPGITIDSHTGQISFTATKAGNYIVVIEVSEFDKPSGKLIGKVTRDIQFVVQACSNNVPTGGKITKLTGTATKVNDYTLSLCESDTFHFDAVFTDIDASDSLSLITNLKKVLPNATITTSGKNPLTATIAWRAPTGSSLKNNSFAITIQDNHCPIPGVQIFGYNILLNGSTTAGQDVTLCSTDSAHLSAKGGAKFTWSVLSGEAIQVGSNFTCNPCASPIAKPSKTTTYIVTSDVNAPCINKDTVTVNVTNQTPPIITQTSTYCSTDGNQQLAVNKTGGIWSGKGITDSIKGTFAPAMAGAGKSLIKYTMPGNCGGYDTAYIDVKQSPNVVITNAGPFCTKDAAITLYANTTGGKWSGTGITDSINGKFSPSVAGGGSHIITYLLAGFCGGKDTATISVSEYPKITPPGIFCTSDTTKKLTGTPSGGTWSGTGIKDGANGIFSPTIAGKGTFKIIYKISGKCDTTSVMLTVNQTPNVTISGAGPFCNTSPATILTATPTGGTWSGTGITNQTGTFNPATVGAGLHTVNYALNIAGCKDSDSTVIKVIKTPAPPQVTTPDVVCQGETVKEVKASGTGGMLTWYSDSSLQNKLGTGETLNINATSNTSYWVTETTENLCTGASATTLVTINPNPNVAFVMDKNRGLAPLTVNFTSTSGTSVVKYSWTFGDDNANTGTADKPTHTYNSSGKYTVKLTGWDKNDCEGTAEATVIVKDSSALEIPNIFTPNGDGQNEQFNVKYIGIKEVQGIIYNRWGEKMYEWNTPSETANWNGKNASDGVYYYIITAVGKDDELYNERGFVTLIK